MLYQIKDGTVSAGGKVILSHIDFEIHGTEKIAVVGKNGAGKTTLLNVIVGTTPLDRDDKRMGPGILCSRKVMTGMLSQQVFADEHRTVEELLMLSCPLRDSFDRERFEYEQEYDRLFTGLGFAKEDKKKPISRFSGGEQTKIALWKLRPKPQHNTFERRKGSCREYEKRIYDHAAQCCGGAASLVH